MIAAEFAYPTTWRQRVILAGAHEGARFRPPGCHEDTAVPESPPGTALGRINAGSCPGRRWRLAGGLSNGKTTWGFPAICWFANLSELFERAGYYGTFIAARSPLARKDHGLLRPTRPPAGRTHGRDRSLAHTGPKCLRGSETRDQSVASRRDPGSTPNGMTPTRPPG